MAFCVTCRLVQRQWSCCRLCGEKLGRDPLGTIPAPGERWQPQGLARAVGGRVAPIDGARNRQILVRSYELFDAHGQLLLRRIDQLAEVVIETKEGRVSLEGAVLLEGSSRPIESRAALIESPRGWPGPVWPFDLRVNLPLRHRLVRRLLRVGRTVLASGPNVVEASAGIGYRHMHFALRAMQGRPGQPVVVTV